MKVTIVGGDFKSTPKQSSVIIKMGLEMTQYQPQDVIIHNGGTPEDIANLDLSGSDLVIWMPNIENEIEKQYPKKDQGAVLICSKVLHGERTEIDAIARIFKMHGNAVVAITWMSDRYVFKLIDALGNVWYNGDHIGFLISSVVDLYEWTKSSVRATAKQSEFVFGGFTKKSNDLDRLIDLNKQVADKFEAIGGRYFGNVSTRCMKMFPSTRINEEFILVSKRNIDKRRITKDDFVKVRYANTVVEYLGDSKPSVDTPIQAALYTYNGDINFMIHGHSYLEGYPYTDYYYPCGDLREVHSSRMLMNNNAGGLNLRNHGFLIYADTIENLENIINNLVFLERNIGNEKLIELV